MPPTIPLDLLQYRDRLKSETGPEGTLLFDPLRRRKVKLTPEELVRQLFIVYLVEEKGFPAGLIAVEKAVKVHGLDKRFDLLAYDRQGQPVMLVECKAPQVALTDKVLSQAAVYNITLATAVVVVTNGRAAYCWKPEAATKAFKFLDSIPDHEGLESGQFDTKNMAK